MNRTAQLAAFVAALLSGLPVEAQPVADRIWSGGSIITMNDSAMRAEAVAEAGGRSSPSAARPK